eukprot:6212281-Pleurochrysis_carterae.AAC.2
MPWTETAAVSAELSRGGQHRRGGRSGVSVSDSKGARDSDCEWAKRLRACVDIDVHTDSSPQLRNGTRVQTGRRLA